MEVQNQATTKKWDGQPLQEIIEYQRDTPKVNLWWGMMKDSIIGPFLFQKAAVRSHSYLYISEQHTVPQLPCDAWLQQDEAPQCFGKSVGQILNKRSPNKLTRRDGFLASPRSPGLTPLDFSV
jgi:hypothetical protein